MRAGTGRPLGDGAQQQEEEAPPPPPRVPARPTSSRARPRPGPAPSPPLPRPQAPALAKSEAWRVSAASRRPAPALKRIGVSVSPRFWNAVRSVAASPAAQAGPRRVYSASQRPPTRSLSGQPLGFGSSRPVHPALRFSSCELASPTVCTAVLGERKLCAPVLVFSLTPSAPREGL